MKKVIETNKTQVKERQKLFIVETDDSMRYVFVVDNPLLSHTEVKFSHRTNPLEENGEVINSSNHRLPRQVVEAVERHFAVRDITMMDGMCEQAERAKQIHKKINDI